MAVNFVAVHERKPWRKHRKHRSLHAAVDGNDGAKNLLRRIGRVGGMWRKYGDVKCVFVWEDHAEAGHAFRLAAARQGAIESAAPSIDQILRFDARKACTEQEIADCFRAEQASDPMLQVAIQPPAPNKVAGPELGIYPDELPAGPAYFEGLAQQVIVNRYERSPEARAASIAYHGCVCQVCKVDFGRRYGSMGDGFIHVHHIVPISSVGAHYRVNPLVDLVPVCPNCHAMLHRRDPPMRIEELRALLNGGQGMSS